MKIKLFSEIPYLQDKNLVLKKLEPCDANALLELVNSPRVYRYLPTFLFEKKYDDINYVIEHLYDECFLASNALKLMIRYLEEATDIEIITASTMVENKASARVLQKNGFELVTSGAEEDWGYERPTLTDKWIR